MSAANDDTSLIEGSDESKHATPPPADPPRDEGLVEEMEEQERAGWLNEPTTG